MAADERDAFCSRASLTTENPIPLVESGHTIPRLRFPKQRDPETALASGDRCGLTGLLNWQRIGSYRGAACDLD